MKHRLWGLALLLFVIGAVIGYQAGSYAPMLRTGSPLPTPTPRPSAPVDGVACTQEAKLCPDGSYVGRQGPRCEFAPCPGIRHVLLYYYDPSKDTDASGNIQCSDQGLVPVARDIAITQTPIQDTVRLLIQGQLTPAERAQGITTEYPLSGFTLTAASLRSGVLTLTFSDPLNKTSGGSCRVGILWAQIHRTALQFEGVTEVRFAPEDLFQP